MRSKRASGFKYAPYARAAWSAAKKIYAIGGKRLRVGFRLRNRPSGAKTKRIRRKNNGRSMGSSIPGRCSVLVRRGGKSKFLKNLTRNSPPRMILQQAQGVITSDTNFQESAAIGAVYTKADFDQMQQTLPALTDRGLGQPTTIPTQLYYVDIALQRVSAKFTLTNTGNSVAFATIRCYVCKKDDNLTPLQRWNTILSNQNFNVQTGNQILTQTIGSTPFQVDGFGSWWKCIKTKTLRLGPGEVHCHDHIEATNRLIRGATYTDASSLYIKGYTKIYTLTLHGEPTLTQDQNFPVVSPAQITWLRTETYKYASVSQNIPQTYLTQPLPVAPVDTVRVMTQLNSVSKIFETA